MAKVRFTDTVVTNQTPPQTFEKGKVYDLSPDAVARWQRRGKAEPVGDDAAPADNAPKKGK